MEIILSAPSKTFVLGEYAALQGYPALLLNSKPRFELRIVKANEFTVLGIEPMSPAGRFIAANLAIFKSHQLNFSDPYHQQGGLGASSAQFLLVYSFYTLIQQKQDSFEQTSLTTTQIELKNSVAFYTELLRVYQTYAWAGRGIPPSGADLVSQLYGELTWYHKTRQTIETFNWPFNDLAIVLVRTGNKLATHQHLAELTQLPTHSFSTILEQAYTALTQTNPLLFLKTINDYAKVLEQNGLTLTFTQALLTQIISLPYVKAAKGCGALGADIILAIVSIDALQNFQDWLTKQQLTHYVAEISCGLTIDRANG